MTECYASLANAIIILAAKDYIRALKVLKKHPRNASADNTRSECESFFRSEWYKALTSIDGEYLIRKLKKEADYDR